MKVNTLKLNSPGYPRNLTTIDPVAQQINYIGTPPSAWLNKPKVAIVGSRKQSAYGKEITAHLAAELGMRGVVIISGLALGIDATAHRACLGVGGCTVAVLPTALGQIYPASHQNLARQIVTTGGCLISEYSEADIIYKRNFADRNRIISGLADLVLITEAAHKSGSLHTARYGLEQGKTIMAVPGNITSATSQGVNNLIKSGALAVTEVGDVLFALGMNPETESLSHFKGSLEEETVLKLIDAGICDQEEMALKSQIATQQLAATLTSLEISGYIRPAGAGNWLRVR